jgi:hypothetical protein
MKIYITYCSAIKNDSLKDTGIKVSPEILYTSQNRIQPFMETCKRKGVRWAIFSDLDGIWFSEEKHAWYEKSPDDVTESEFKALLANFDNRLQEYDEIYFYRPNERRFHSLYKRLLQETKLHDRVKLISSIIKIK